MANTLSRIEYIEPMHISSLDRLSKFSYENYNMYVDLVIHLNKRALNSNTFNEDEIFRLKKTNDGKYVFANSMMGGTAGNLTTNYTNATNFGYDAANNTSEGIGVESIDITYDKNFIPQVSMKIVDVRGLSFFTPQELSYVERLKTGNDNNYGMSIVNSMFTLPPADFFLIVKGFYGKPVKFKLIVSDLKVAFNDNSGNFEINVKMIGKPFGVYVDLPLSFISVAPLLTDYVGAKYWEEKSEDFSYDNGASILTFLEFKRRVTNLFSISNGNMNRTEDPDTSAETDKNQDKKNVLNELNQKYDEFQNTFKEEIKSKKDEYFEEQIKVGSDVFINHIFLADKDIKIENHQEELLPSIDNFKTSYKWEDITEPDFIGYKQDFKDEEKFQHFVSKIGVMNITSKKSKKDGECKIEISCAAQYRKFFISDENQQTEIYNKIISWFNELNEGVNPEEGKTIDTEYKLFYFNDKNLKKAIKEKINGTERKDKDLSQKTYEERVINLNETLGFIPTVENIFKMIFAHIDTFVASFYSVLTAIEKEGTNRNMASLGLTKENSDINSDDNNKIVPPFPAVFKNENGTGKKVYVKPGETYNGSHVFSQNKFEELKLVDAIFNAARQYSEELNRIDELNGFTSIVGGEGTTSQFFPTNKIDIFNFKTFQNPYVSLVKQDGLEACIKDGFDAFFVIKYINSLFTNDPEIYGTAEALNFIKAFQNSKFDVSKYIDSDSDKRIDDILSKMKNNEESGNIWNITGAGAVFDANSKEYIWIKNDEGKIYYPLYIDGFNVLKREIESNINFIENRKTRWVLNENKDNEAEGLKGEGGCNNNFKFKEKGFSYKKVLETISNDSLFESLKDEENYKKNIFDADKLTGEENGYKEGKKHYLEAKDSRIAFTDKNDPLLIFDFERGPHPLSDISYITICSYKNKKIEIKEFTSPVIFNHDTYLDLQSNDRKWEDSTDAIYAKAYLFLWSIPSYFLDGADVFYWKGKHRNLCSLLQEGAFWWRYKTMTENNDQYDPVYIDPTKYKVAKRYEIYKIKNPDYPKKKLSTSSMTFIEENVDKEEYKYMSIWIDIHAEDRRNKLCDFFKEWATSSDFKVLREELKEVPSKDSSNKGVGNYYNRFGYKETLDGVARPGYTDRYEAEYGNSGKNSPYRRIKNWSDSERKANSNLKNSLPFRACIKGYNEYDNGEPNTTSPTGVQIILMDLVYTFHSIFDYRKYNYKYISENDPVLKLNEENVKKAYKIFKNTIKDKLQTNGTTADTGEERSTSSNSGGGKIEKDMKLSIYLTLKQLYDYHFCGEKQERWNLGNPNSDFENIIYVDQFYNDISNKVLLNAKTVNNCLVGYIPTSTEDRYSAKVGGNVYSFIGDIISDAGMSFHAFPLKNATTNEFSIKEMFTPKFIDSPYDASGNFYWCLYSSKPSEHLDAVSEFRDDSFDIADSAGNISPTAPESLRSSGKYKVPAFGVTFGRQNQSFFKNIKVNMDNFKQSEYSIEAEMNVASEGSSGTREVSVFGQDIYSVFSNYCYTCSVESMGNMQIMPGMMFQLNNIPMFKGTYMIMNVSHKIVPGDITTTFTGVRMNRASLPLVEDSVLYIDSDGTLLRGNGTLVGGKRDTTGSIIKFYDGYSEKDLINLPRSKFIGIYYSKTKGRTIKYSNPCNIRPGKSSNPHKGSIGVENAFRSSGVDIGLFSIFSDPYYSIRAMALNSCIKWSEEWYKTNDFSTKWATETALLKKYNKPIPPNERTIYRIVNHLAPITDSNDPEKYAKDIYNSDPGAFNNEYYTCIVNVAANKRQFVAFMRQILKTEQSTEVKGNYLELCYDAIYGVKGAKEPLQGSQYLIDNFKDGS